MATLFLTHPPDALKNYYGDKAVAGLRALGELRINPLGRELTTPELIAAAQGCEIQSAESIAVATGAAFARLMRDASR